MKLAARIKLKEKQIELARASLTESVRDARTVLHQRLSSRTALAIGFGGGVALGWLGRRRRRPALPLPQRARESMPRHWLGHYIVWPFLLATARDWVVSRRPSLKE